MIHIAIVEDENIYAAQIIEFIHRFQKEKEVDIKITRFADGDEIIDNYSGDYGIILMDIQMQFMDGMTAAEEIRRLDTEVIIIFITNMTEYAVRGYEVDALDYIVKPLEYFSFARKLDRALKRIKESVHCYLSVTTENGVKKLDVDDILYIEIQDHTLIYVTEKERTRARGRAAMREIEERMLPYGFFRNNNCYLANLKWVQSVKENSCMVKDYSLQISRSRKKAFMNALVQYISEEKI